MKRDYELAVCLKLTDGKEIYTKTTSIALWDDFVEEKNPKEQCFGSHVNSFLETLETNSNPAIKQTFKKWSIHVVKYGLNIGSEINGDRPSIVFKNSEDTQGGDITVIPLTSAVSHKFVDKYDKIVTKDQDNGLFANSYARLRQLGCVSVKKVGKCLGKITNEQIKHEINKEIEKMLATQE